MNNPDRNYDRLKLNPSHFLILWFGITILAGATLLNLPFASVDGNSIGFIDALFTSASAVCVTGLIVVNTAVHWTLFGKIVILILIQIGGLGIMTMATLIAFLLGRRITLKDRLLIREELNATTLQGIVLLTKRVLIMTIGIELIGAIFLSFTFTKELGMIKGIWYSIFHAVSAFCNAGFDITGNSLVDYSGDVIINVTVMSLIILGGIGFYVVMEVLRDSNIDIIKILKENYFNSIQRKFPDEAWTFLTGNAENIKKITDAVGFHYKPNDDDFIHAGALMAISKDGKISRYIYGSTYNPFDVKMALIDAGSGKTNPTINKALQFCFSYDPEGRGYTLNITRIFGSIMLISLGIFLTVLLIKKKKKN